MPSYASFELKDGTYQKQFVCSRIHSHQFYFTFEVRGQVLCKMGQSPSIADINKGQIRQYKSVLDPEDYAELSRAIGLVTHGIGIGSFVYLRRIFERLVEEAHQASKSDSTWDESTYASARMDERIALLKSSLPQFMVEQRTLYSILSKGIHSLSEEECLAHFPVVQTGIELILDQKLALHEQKRKLAEATKAIALIHQKLKAT